MGYNTQDTVWPDHPVPDAVKALMGRFFNLLDSHDSNVGNILADEIFTPDAKAQFGAHISTGRDGKFCCYSCCDVQLFFSPFEPRKTNHTLKHRGTSPEIEIRKSRDNAWTLFNARKHTVLRAYSSNDAADDLLFIAWVAMDLKNGEHVAGEFIGRLRFENTDTPNPKIKSYAIWAVSSRGTATLMTDRNQSLY